jgi:hypothetical protein
MTQTTEAAPAAEATPTSEAPVTENTAPVETKETTPETAETTEAETSAEETQTDKPRSLNRTQRLQRKAARLATMLAEKDAELSELRAKSGDGADTEPKEADFNGDYFAYQRALSKWDAKQLLKEVLPKQESKTDTAAPEREEFFSELRERIEEVKPLLPDFWEKLQGLTKEVGDLNVVVFDELDKADNPEAVLYHIASNPRLAAKLNKLSPSDVVREIAKLDATASLPKPRKQTQAPPPMTQPSGGATPPKDIASAAKADDLTAYFAMRDAQERAKRG